MTETPDPRTDLDQIAARIAELCEAKVDGEQPYLLSRLGLDLGQDMIRLKALGIKRLAPFFQARLSDRFQLLQTASFGVVVIARAGERPAVASVEENRSKQSPRYHYRFWAAFSVPSNGLKRYLNLSNFTFVQHEQPEAAPPDTILIDEEFIAPQTAPDRDELIKVMIERWLQKNNLPKERFLQSAKSLDRSQGFRPLGRSTALELLLSSLDRRQLQQTSLPLDVIATLLQKRL